MNHMDIDWAEIQSFFFRAMLNGWINDDRKPWLIPPGGVLPGFKGFYFPNGALDLMDQWSKSSKSGKSAGQTIIWHNQTPIWIMHYGGVYKKEALPFLKEVLRKTYSEETFFGGRGSAQIFGDKLTYVNSVEKDSFTMFSGHEEIIENDDFRQLGFHDYWGMSLI